MKPIGIIAKALAAAYVATAVIVVCGASIHAATVTIAAYPAPPEPAAQAVAQQQGKGHQPIVAAELAAQVLQPLWVADTAEVDKPHYAISDAERSLIESIVMAEAGNQGLTGQMLVAQCILTACLEDDTRPAEAIERYQYTKPNPAPTDSVKEAVATVFDRGELPSTEPIKYFYAYKVTYSSFHESRKFVLQFKDHRFFI